MADRNVALTVVKGGINRQRTKGGALNESLYDLVNAYITRSKTIVPRPGTLRVYDLSGDSAGASLSKGLVSHDGGLHVFCHELIDVPPGITLHIITHPDQTSNLEIPILEINFAAPFMGFLFVAATFDINDGETYLFWLQSGDAWEAETVYSAGDIVVPTNSDGSLAFQAQRISAPNPSWAPDVERAIGDVIEPTVYNDYYYTVVDTQGTNPRSGATEPVWPTEDGAQVTEDADGAEPTPPSVTQPPDASKIPSPSIEDRYTNIFRHAVD